VSVVCDPLGRFEKVFWEMHLCRKRGPLDRKDPVTFGPERNGRCFERIGEALQYPELIEHWNVAQDLGSMDALFGPRLWILHQESLRLAGRAAYDGIAGFLGQRPFGAGSEFGRYNSARGHRTELCHNRSVIRGLKRLLAPEYQAIEALLQARGREVPEQLRRRDSRCDRPEELRGDPFTKERGA